MSSANLSHRLFLAITLGSFLATPALHAQLGVSPSQNSTFLREIRERHAGKASPDPMGEDRVALQRSRSLTEPTYLSDSLMSATRLASDLTTYSGQFQADRQFLSPWTGTQPAPDSAKGGGTSHLGAALDQSFEWNSVDASFFPFFPFFGRREAYLSTTMISLDGAYGTLESGRLTLQAAGGFSLAESDELLLPERDGILAWFIQPGSSIIYDIQRGPVTLTLYDRVSARSDAFLAGRSRLSPFFFNAVQNDLGVALSVDLAESLTFTANYNWAAAQPMQSNLNELASRDVHSLLVSLAYEIKPGLSVGVEGGQAWSDYEIEFSADGRQWHGGLFAEAALPWTHRLRLEGGVQGMEFVSLQPPTIFFFGPFFPTPNQLSSNIGDQSDLSISPYYSLTLTGRLCQSVTHELSAGYEAALAPLSNFVQSHYVNYGLHAALWNGAALGLSGFFEDTRDSGGIFAADRTLMGGVAQLEQKIGSKLSLSLGYGFTHGNPEAQPQSTLITSNDFNQHAYSAAIAYQLCPKSSLRL